MTFNGAQGRSGGLVSIVEQLPAVVGQESPHYFEVWMRFPSLMPPPGAEPKRTIFNTPIPQAPVSIVEQLPTLVGQESSHYFEVWMRFP